jgi:hemerythrin-like domain-containing protein
MTPYQGATEEQLRNPLVRELLGIHNMFRSELATMMQHMDELIAGKQTHDAPETTKRIQAIILTGARYAQILHMHHHIETSVLFPSLQEDGLDGSVIDRLNADHDDIGVLIDRFSAAVRHLSTLEPEVPDSDLRRLADALHTHLAYEETHVCPLLARHTLADFH